MATIDQAINFTQMFQDVELSHALQKLRQDPQALQRFLQESQDKLYKEVTTQKDDTFQKVYGDLERASDTERAVYYYNQRNQDLNRLQEQVYNAQKGSADAVLHDRDLAKRQYEINQWSSGNKLDTLFIYSQLFIILCTFALLLYIWQNGILSKTIISVLILVLLLIFIFTIVNRAQFTNFLRDGRFWNRRKFPTYQGIPIPNICDSSSVLQSAESQLSSLEQSTRSSLQQGLQSMSSKIADSTQSVNQQIQKI
jgi:hypothetical protein